MIKICILIINEKIVVLLNMKSKNNQIEIWMFVAKKILFKRTNTQN